jgi:nitrate reductase gamma subunit
MRDHLVFAVAPYVVLLAFVPVCLVRYFLWRGRRHQERTPPPEPTPAARARTAGRLALAVIGLGHVVAFAFPEYLLVWTRQPVRLAVLEASGGVAAIVAIVGLGLSGVLTARRWRDHGRHAVDVVAAALVFTSMLSGLGLAALYRWASVWSGVTLLPYLHSLGGLDPQISLVTYLPPLVKLHVASAIAVVAVLPFTRMARVAIVRVDGWARRAVVPIGALAGAGRAAVDAAISVLHVFRSRVLRNKAED